MPNISFVDAAYQILKKENKPLSSAEITSKALAKGLISTQGKTPSATMGAVIYMEIKNKGSNSRFIKVGRGRFGLSDWVKRKDVLHFRPFTFKSAAYKVLKLANKPLNIQDITQIALKKKWLKTSGKTPEATMGAQLYTHIKRQKEKSFFVQLGKNKFGLREWGLDVLEKEIEREEYQKEVIVSDRERSIVGDPINFKGLIYGPLNENGVIFLFSKLHSKLGINIEAIQASFPDAKGRRKTSRGWENVWIEFEYKSSTFKIHGHDPKECDIIVCWEDDWKNCPIEVIELKKVIEGL